MSTQFRTTHALAITIQNRFIIMQKIIFISLFAISSALLFGQNKTQSSNAKDDVNFSEKKGWKIIKIQNTTFSATFIDDFKSKESSENWDLHSETGGSSTIEYERLTMKLNNEGRIRVPILEAPMDLSKRWQRQRR